MMESQQWESRQWEDLPFLAALCWQGSRPAIAQLTAWEILQIYERNWRWRGVMADISEPEAAFIHQLATQYHSWLVNEV